MLVACTTVIRKGQRRGPNMGEVLPAVSVKVTLFENKVFADDQVKMRA